MQDVFKLLGSDVYEVERIEALEGEPLPAPPARAEPAGRGAPRERAASRCTSLDETLNAVLASLNDHLGIRHAMVLMLDPAAQRLYTVASCGYHLRRGLRDRRRARRDRRGRAGTHAGAHRPHDERRAVHAGHAQQLRRQRAGFRGGGGDPLPRTGAAAQPAGRADPQRWPHAGRAVRGEHAGTAVQLRGRGCAGGDRRPPGCGHRVDAARPRPANPLPPWRRLRLRRRPRPWRPWW